MPLASSQGTFHGTFFKAGHNPHRPSVSSQWTPFPHTSGTCAPNNQPFTSSHATAPSGPTRGTMQGRARLWQCSSAFFFLSAAARLGNVAVVPMRPASLQPYEERRGGGSFVSVPDVLGWFGRFFYLAFFFLHCLTRDGGDGRARGRQAWWFGGVGRGRGEVTPHRYGWADRGCEISLRMMRRGDVEDGVLVFVGGDDMAGAQSAEG